MFKKLLKIIGSFFLIVVLLLIGTAVWFAISSSKYTEIAGPYLEKNMPAVASWDYEQFKPLLTPEALEEFDTERGQKIYKAFSKLGTLKSFDKPQFIAANTGVSVGTESYDEVIFTLQGHFQTGDALFTITLVKNNNSYLINRIRINSDVFIE